MSRPANWTPAEVESLLQLAGDVPYPVLSRCYNMWARRHGFPRRTPKAVVVKAQKCGATFTAVGSWLTTGGVARILGVRPSTVESWTARYPSLPRSCYGGTRPVRYIKRSRLRRWAEDHMHLFGGLEHSRLVMLFEDEEFADRILALHPNRPSGIEATALSVRCVDDGRVWQSLMAAARSLYVTHGALWHAIKENRPVLGLRLELIDS